MIHNYINVAIYIDNEYVVPATVMVLSLTENLERSYRIKLFVLGLNISDESKSIMEASWPKHLIEPQWIDIRLKKDELGFIPVNYLSQAAYLRLMIDRCLPHQIDKVLTLDCDGVVLGDVSEVWRKSPTIHPVMAVQDPCVKQLGQDFSPFIQSSEFSHYRSEPYMNSGFMLINLRKWREEQISQRCIDLASRWPGQALYADQSLINAILKGNWEPLPPKWNCNLRHLKIHSLPLMRNTTYRYDEIMEAKVDPGFIHFLSRHKPWHAKGFHPHKELYLHYLKRTSWINLVTPQNSISKYYAQLQELFFPLLCSWQGLRLYAKNVKHELL